MIEELGMLLMLFVGMGVIFTALIVGKAIVSLWRFVADYRGETRRIEELRWDNTRTQLAHLQGVTDAHQQRLNRIELAMYPPGPSKPLDGIPKDVPRAPEVQT